MTKVYCFANNKGGSGKSTTCANVAYAMALEGLRVLMIDGDGQSNLTLSYFDEEQTLAFAENEQNLYAYLRAHISFDEVIVKTAYENLDLLPACAALSSVDNLLLSAYEKEYVFREKLQRILDSELYDAICIDAPPTLGLWVTNLLCASNALIIPVEASPWGLYGLANMFDFYAKAQAQNKELDFLGVLVTKADERKNYFKQTVADLKELPDIHFFETYVHVDSAVEWAQDSSKPVIAYKKSSRSAKEYQKLTKEILKDAGR
ncbi:MAG: AAA family ATPase [Clostridia bacterium]|nr:AAA family ATPase [Clostridia bacterium]MBO7150126.1 AAA family ATPase [Clostridia bacterium]